MGCDCVKFREKRPDSQPTIETTESTKRSRSEVSLDFAELHSIRMLEKPLASWYRVRSTIVTTDTQSLHQAEFIGTKQQCYLKKVPKLQGAEGEKQKLEMDMQAERLARLDHPFVLRLYETLQDSENYYLAMEMYPAGTLASYSRNPLFRRDEYLARVAIVLLSSLAHAHSMEVVHGRLSPNTIVLSEAPNPENWRVKITGFSDLDSMLLPSSADFDASHFTAPDKKPTAKSDVWSLGAVLYTLATSESPFAAVKKGALKKAKQKGVNFEGPEWEGRDPLLLELLAGMMQPLPKDRPTAAKCRSHPWLKKNLPAVKPSKVAQCLQQLRRYTPGNPLKEGIMKFILCRLLREQEYEELAEFFIFLDRVDGDGQISIAELAEAYKRILQTESADEAAQQIMDSADQNQSGTLSYTEFLFATVGEEQILSAARVGIAFKCFDGDNSGAVSVAELQEVLCLHKTKDSEKRWKKLFSVADKSNDGLIDVEEFKAMMLTEVPKQKPRRKSKH